MPFWLVLLSLVFAAGGLAAPAAAAAPPQQDRSAAAAYARLLEAGMDAARPLLLEGRADAAVQVLQAAEVVLSEPGLPPRRVASFRIERARAELLRDWLTGGSLDRARAALERLVPSIERSADQVLRADLANLLAVAWYWSASGDGDLDAALTHADRALALRQQLDDQRGFAESLIVAAMIHAALDPAPRGAARRDAPLLEEALTLARTHGHAREEGAAARHLARLALEEGDLDAALDHATNALSLLEASGDRIEAVPALLALGEVWMTRGDHKAARAILDDALEAARRMGAARFEVDARLALSRVEERRGEIAQARRRAEEARTIAEKTGYTSGRDAAVSRLAELAPP
jgi:tetratricopeptide (TPR) repeat protein